MTYAILLARTRFKQVVTVGNAIVRKQITRYPHFVEKFEQRFANYVGMQHGLSFCNGTSAIEAALFAVNIGKGDEVLVPSFTFHASIDPIINLGAKPVFVDVESRTYTICPSDVARKITNKTKAIVIVHLFGMPANMEKLLAILKGRDITIIEDVSQAHGAQWNEQLCGSFGHFGAFSLQGDKAIAGGEGGIVVTNDFLAKVRMSMWGHFTRHAEYFSDLNADEFRFTGIGFKRRMAPVSALLADADLDHINKINQMMNDSAEVLDQALGNIDGIEIAQPHTSSRRGGFTGGYPIYLTNDYISADTIVDRLKAEGVNAYKCPYAMHHKLPIYIDENFRQALISQKPTGNMGMHSSISLPVTERLNDRLFLLSRRYLISMGKKTLSRIQVVLRHL